jgi:nucleotide-binding universal stress UspA family protein
MVMIKDILNLKKIIWCVDAFEEKKDFQEKALRMLNTFQNKTHAQIEPLYVLSSTEANWPVNYGSDLMSEVRENLRHRLEGIVQSEGHPQVMNPKILVEPSSSTSAAVENLLEYAHHHLADLIIVSSHGRRGLDRLFLGSFSETLLVHSTIPVLVIGASARVDQQVGKILFATDFGELARDVFRRTVSIAQQVRAELTLFHAVPVPSRVTLDTGFYPAMFGVEGEMVTLESFMEMQGQHQQRRADSWSEWAQAEGVPCTADLDMSGEPVDRLICHKALQDGSDLIVMEGRSNAIKAALMGSIARDVVRSAPCPVLVLPRLSLREKAPELSEEVTSRVPERHIDFSLDTGALSR